MTIEEWRPIPGYEGKYEASSLGRIKSVARDVMLGGKKHRTVDDRIMTLHTHNNGYKVVWLRAPGSHKKFYVHRLIAAAFMQKPDDKQVVNHKDRDRHNNSLHNLEWLTFQENTHHWQEAERQRVIASNADF